MRLKSFNFLKNPYIRISILMAFWVGAMISFFIYNPAPRYVEEKPKRYEIVIDLEGTMDDFLHNAPGRLPRDNPPEAGYESFKLVNLEPRVRRKGKEVFFKKAESIHVRYECDYITDLYINIDPVGKNISELKEELRTLLPAIDSLGFKRSPESTAFSADNLPLPTIDEPNQGGSIHWQRKNGDIALKLSFSIPFLEKTPERKYHLSFSYYDLHYYPVDSDLNHICPSSPLAKKE